MTTADARTGAGGEPTPGLYPIIAAEGWPIIGVIVAGAVLLTLAVWLVFGPWPALIAALPVAAVVGWSLWFFRDPDRNVPAGAGLVVSPADGAVCFVGPANPPLELMLKHRDAILHHGTPPPPPPPGPETPASALRPSASSLQPPASHLRISIFMNVFNVHVNRAPIAATVAQIAYRPGRFINAVRDKASEENERCGLVLRLPGGGEIAVVQIAGLIARRIVCRAKEGQDLARGERFGIIRFGSRVDVYLPPDAEPAVKPGDRAAAGETVIATLPNAVADA